MPEAPSATGTGRILGAHYQVHRCLKEDCGIATFLGKDLEQGAPVIIKTAAAETVSAGMQMRLEHEAQVLRNVDSPHLVSLLQVGREQGMLFLVMPYVEGVTLEARLKPGPLSARDALTVGAGVMRALAAAHDQGVLHRDIKPANVIVDEGSQLENITLIDFGLARSNRLSASIRDVPVGTANYMSPEQAGLLHHDVDERSDLYSAGALLFEALTGHPPFSGEGVADVLRQHVTAEAPELRSLRSAIPHSLGELVHRLLRKDPRDRYQSAEAVAADLDEIASAMDAGAADPHVVIGLRDRRHTLTDPAFVGRESELRVLEEELQRASDGAVVLALIEADSGGGKTRLLDELARRGRELGAWVLRGQSFDQVAQSPLQALDGVLSAVVSAADEASLAERIRTGVRGHEVALLAAAPQLRGLLGDFDEESVGPEAHGELRTVRALAALVDSLGTESQPALLMLDDCQWADEVTVDLLRFWRRQAQEEGGSRHVMLAGAFRSEEVSAGHPLRDLDASAHVSLPPLGAAEVRSLLESMAGALPEDAVQIVLRLSDGSPFMAAEILRGLVETGALTAEAGGWRTEPDLMEDVQSSRRAAVFLARRLEQLSTKALRLLSIGAVLGKEFDLDAVVALAEEKQHSVISSLYEAERHHVLWADAQGTRYQFVHDKLREALLDRLSDDERRRLHLAAAERTESLAPDHKYDLAYHFDAAGEVRRALPHALAAAEEARARHALGIAEHQYRIAERGAARADRDLQERIQEGLGDILMLRGRYEAAAHHFANAQALAEIEMRRAEIDGKLGELALKRGDIKEASESIERGLRLLRQPVPRRKTTIFWMLLRELIVQVLHTALPRLFVGRRSLDDGEVDLLAARLYSRLAYAYWFGSGRVPCAWAHFREMNLTERYPHTLEMAQAYSEHAPVMTMLPWFTRGLSYAERSLAIRKSFGDVWGQGQSLNFIAIGLYAASRYDDAMVRFREAIRILDRTGDRWEANTAGWHVAFCLYRLGRLKEAVETAQRIHQSGLELGDSQASGISVGAWAKAATGRIPRKVVHAELARPSDDVHRTAEVLQAEGARLLAEGRPSEAVEVLARGRKLVKVAGLRQEYVAPIFAWLATALRAQAETVTPWAPDERRALLKRAKRAAEEALRIARSFQNNLPHALREKGLVEAMSGHGHRARVLLDRSLAVAERQDARYERAQTLVARGRVGLALDWADAASDIAHGRDALRELGEGAEPDEEEKPVTLSLMERFAAVLETGRLIASALSHDSVFAAVRESALVLLRCDRCLILETRQAPGGLRIEPLEAHGAAPFSRTVVERAVETGEPVLFTEDSGEDTSESVILSRIPSVLCAPIVVRGSVVACFYVMHEEVGGFFSEEEERLARFVSALAGAALENAEGFAEVEELSRTLEQRVEERAAELSRANRELKREMASREWAEAVLRRSEERYRVLAENSADIISIADSDSRLKYVSPSCRAVLGYEPVDLLERSAVDFVHPDDRSMLLDIYATVLDRDEVVTMPPYRALRKDGSYAWVESTVRRIRDEATGEVEIQGSARDVTERKQREAELERLAAIIESSGDAIIGKDRSGTITTWNHGAERIYGYRPDEVLGRPMSVLMPPGHERELEDILSVMKKGEGLDYHETKRLTKRGDVIDVSLTLSLVRDEAGEIIGASSIARDVTERKRSERYLQTQHEVTRALAESGTVEQALRRVLETLGQHLGWQVGSFWEVEERSEVIRCSEVWHAPDLDISEFSELSRQLTVERGSGAVGQVWKTGRPLLIESLLEDPSFARARACRRIGLQGGIFLPIATDNRVVGVLEFFTREVKRPDKALTETMAGLGSQVGQFIERRRAEDEADRIKDEFFSLVSHEFRTPLTSIVGYIELLLEGDGTAFGEEERLDFLKVVKRNSDRLRRLVDDLLFISKVQSGKFSISPRDVDLLELASEALEAARPLAEGNGLDLRLHAAALEPFRGDPDRLAQLFDNLISNAVKYSPEGERVEVRLAHGYGQVTAEVTNTGVHIPKHDLERLFEPFFRSTAASQAPGVGLGLTIAQSIAAAHGGKIAVASEEGAGTTFRVELPLRPADDSEVLDSGAVAA
jgi:two-component system sensor kinase